MFNIINFILIITVGWIVINYILRESENNDRLLKYVTDLEKQMNSQARAQEKIVEALSVIDKDLENEKHLRETDYSNTMNSLFNLSNDINRAKMRVARMEQESLKDIPQGKFPIGYDENENFKKQMVEDAKQGGGV